MIIPDANVVIYAHNRSAPNHEAYRTWWEELVRGPREVGLDWTVALAFVRLLSNPLVVPRPDPPARLLEIVQRILQQSPVRIVTPGHDHATIMRELFTASGASSRLTTDIHLAALAIELDATLATNDADFARFPGLKLLDPAALQ